MYMACNAIVGIAHMCIGRRRRSRAAWREAYEKGIRSRKEESNLGTPRFQVNLRRKLTSSARLVNPESNSVH